MIQFEDIILNKRRFPYHLIIIEESWFMEHVPVIFLDRLTGPLGTGYRSWNIEKGPVDCWDCNRKESHELKNKEFSIFLMYIN